MLVKGVTEQCLFLFPPFILWPPSIPCKNQNNSTKCIPLCFDQNGDTIHGEAIEREPPSSSIKRVSIAFSSAWIPLFYDDCHLHNSIDCNYINNDGSGKHPKVENWVLEKSCWIGLIQTEQSFSLFFCHVLNKPILVTQKSDFEYPIRHWL